LDLQLLAVQPFTSEADRVCSTSCSEAAGNDGTLQYVQAKYYTSTSMVEHFPPPDPQEHIYVSYREMADFTLPVAMHSGLPFSDEALERQRLVSGCVGLTDYMWDNSLDARQPFLEYCDALEKGVKVDPPAGVHPLLAEDLSTLVQEIEPSQAKALFDMGRTAVAKAAEYSVASDPRQYMDLRAQEARSAARMMTCILPDAESQHPAFPRYAILVDEVSVARNAVDSIKDLTSDFEEGRTRVEPTLANRTWLAAVAAQQVLRSCSMLGVKLSVDLLSTSVAHSRARSQRKF